MDIKSYFSDKLSKILFLEFTSEKIQKIFSVKINNSSIYIPINTFNIFEKVKTKGNLEEIPISFFIEGMFFVLGADNQFKFNNFYKKILLNKEENIKFIKGKIFKKIENKNYEEGYILLKGLVSIESNKENYDKLIMLCNSLRNKDNMYKDEELKIILESKKFKDYATPYFYEALTYKDEGDFEKALFCINNYISKGGKETIEVTEFKCSLQNVINYEEGKKLICDNPTEGLKKLIPLLKEFNNDPQLYYYIAIGYRILENYEKAIFYLNEALNIDSDMVQAVNELGINYACLGNFNNAIMYFRKAFEVTKSIEICTNLIMCYLNIKNIKEAKNHLKIAKKLNPNDEVVKELENLIK